MMRGTVLQYEKASLVGIGLVWGLTIGRFAPDLLWVMAIGCACVPTILFAIRAGIEVYRRAR